MLLCCCVVVVRCCCSLLLLLLLLLCCCCCCCSLLLFVVVVVLLLLFRVVLGLDSAGPPSDRPPSARPPKISLFFFPLPPPFRSFSVSLGVFSLNLVVFLKAGTLKCARMGSRATRFHQLRQATQWAEENVSNADIVFFAGDRNFVRSDSERWSSASSVWRPSLRMNATWGRMALLHGSRL